MADNSSQIRNQAVDYITAGVKGGLGAVPIAGSLLAEIAGSIIPNQRVDRIADFTIKLEERINGLESQAIADQLKDEEFTDLVEEALRQAARSTSEERRDYLASLLAKSITSEAIEHSESKHLLRILGELNDVEVLWLRFFHHPVIGGDKEFRELHAGVLERKHLLIRQDPGERDKASLQKSYHDHLTRLDLIEKKISKDKHGNPEFDSFTGDFKRLYTHITALGDLLLHSIGLI